MANRNLQRVLDLETGHATVTGWEYGAVHDRAGLMGWSRHLRDGDLVFAWGRRARAPADLVAVPGGWSRWSCDPDGIPGQLVEQVEDAGWYTADAIQAVNERWPVARPYCRGDHEWAEEFGNADDDPEHPAAQAGFVYWSPCKRCPAWCNPEDYLLDMSPKG